MSDAIPSERSVLLPFISDPKNDGSMELHVTGEELFKLWEKIDAMQEAQELVQRYAEGGAEEAIAYVRSHPAL